MYRLARDNGYTYVLSYRSYPLGRAEDFPLPSKQAYDCIAMTAQRYKIRLAISAANAFRTCYVKACVLQHERLVLSYCYRDIVFDFSFTSPFETLSRTISEQYCY